jgi:hypothetical protein
VPDPALCLKGIADAVNPGGILVLTSPFTWLEEYTAKDKWVGGCVDEATGGAVRCADALKAMMASHGFTVLEEGKVRQKLYVFVVSWLLFDVFFPLSSISRTMACRTSGRVKDKVRGVSCLNRTPK